MIFHKTGISDVYLIELEPKHDERGYFCRLFCQNEFREAGLPANIAQVNLSLTKRRGAIRGLHWQKEPKAMDKIVQCLAGKIFDVAVDLRPDSPNYRKWTSMVLSGENRKLFFIPKGFAHGFQALTDNCLMQYFITEFYSPEHEFGARWDDPAFNISWPIANPFLSEKDKNWPLIKQ